MNNNYDKQLLIINALFKNKLIDFNEWYKSLLKLMDKYGLVYEKDK